MRTVIVIGLLLPLAAMAQSFNIDLDISGGSPAIGFGVPSDAFGGAANQPGRWNRHPSTGAGTTSLVDLLGNTTAVTLRAVGGIGTGGGFNQPLNTGDFALLLNDFSSLANGEITWIFSGLLPGHYRVYSYAANPAYLTTVPTSVTVPYSSSQSPQIVTGPMPGNAFQHLVTHAEHDVLITADELRVSIIGLDQTRLSAVNGFQIVVVPEPAALLILGTALIVMSRRPFRRA